MPNVVVSLVNKFQIPVSGATVELFADLVAPATVSGVTSGTGITGFPVDPGTYTMKVTIDSQTRTLGTYVVKRAVPIHFSGIEITDGDPAMPERFRLTRYDHSAHNVNTGLVQRVNWRVVV